jgi:hypothetical protein
VPSPYIRTRRRPRRRLEATDQHAVINGLVGETADRSGLVALIARDDLAGGPVHPGQAIEPQTNQDPMDC